MRKENTSFFGLLAKVLQSVGQIFVPFNKK